MHIIAILQGLLTPMIAIAVAFIGWQQWKLNHDRFALDTYDRRIGAYREVQKLLGTILRNGSIENGEMMQFYGAVAESEFLFGNDIKDYNDLLYKNGVQLAYLNNLYSRGIKGEVPNYNNEETVEKESKAFKWFTEQYEPAKALYGKYLKIDRAIG